MRVFGLAIVGVLLVMAALGYAIYQLVPIPHNGLRFTREDWTVFAGMFGAVVGTFFSAVAFAGLIYTARMQRQELSLQREELRETRES